MRLWLRLRLRLPTSLRLPPSLPLPKQPPGQVALWLVHSARRRAYSCPPAAQVDHVAEEGDIKEAVGRVAVAQPRPAVRQLAERVERTLAGEERLKHKVTSIVCAVTERVTVSETAF